MSVLYISPTQWTVLWGKSKCCLLSVLSPAPHLMPPVQNYLKHHGANEQPGSSYLAGDKQQKLHGQGVGGEQNSYLSGARTPE